MKTALPSAPVRDVCPKCHGYGVYERRFWAPKPDTGWHLERVCPTCGWSEPIQ